MVPLKPNERNKEPMLYDKAKVPEDEISSNMDNEAACARVRLLEIEGKRQCSPARFLLNKRFFFGMRGVAI